MDALLFVRSGCDYVGGRWYLVTTSIGYRRDPCPYRYDWVVLLTQTPDKLEKKSKKTRPMRKIVLFLVLRYTKHNFNS